MTRRGGCPAARLPTGREAGATTHTPIHVDPRPLPSLMLDIPAISQTVATTATSMKKALLATTGVTVTIFVAASLAGHPIYGRPVVKDNRPLLQNSVSIGRLEAPNLVVTSTGDRLKVEGIIFEDRAIASPPGDLPKFFNDPDPLRIGVDPSQPSGVSFESRVNYFCGNTFFARFLPKPLPRYRIADFGQGLVARSLARELD
jgi:hypothetical protein